MKSEAAVLSANRRRALRAAFALLVHAWQSAGAVGALSAEALPLRRFAPRFPLFSNARTSAGAQPPPAPSRRAAKPTHRWGRTATVSAA